jgi:hypothetical protein
MVKIESQIEKKKHIGAEDDLLAQYRWYCLIDRYNTCHEFWRTTVDSYRTLTILD